MLGLIRLNLNLVSLHQLVLAPLPVRLLRLGLQGLLQGFLLVLHSLIEQLVHQELPLGLLELEYVLALLLEQSRHELPTPTLEPKPLPLLLHGALFLVQEPLHDMLLLLLLLPPLNHSLPEPLLLPRLLLELVLPEELLHRQLKPRLLEILRLNELMLRLQHFLVALLYDVQ